MNFTGGSKTERKDCFDISRWDVMLFLCKQNDESIKNYRMIYPIQLWCLILKAHYLLDVVIATLLLANYICISCLYSTSY